MKTIRFVIRKDSKPTFTQQGYLKVRAYATRTGVFTYRENGKTILEGRLPEHVNDPKSLETLRNVPVTNGHPAFMLTPQNTSKYQVGYTGDRVEIEQDNLIGIDLIITDIQTINDILSGKKVELSCGYTCVLVKMSGVIDGESYDYIQTEIIYNHVAVVEEGRAGHKVKIQLDSSTNETIRLDSETNRVFRCDDYIFDISDIPKEEKTVKFNLDGKEIDIPDAVAQDVISGITKRDEQLKEVPTLKQKIDSINGELEMTKTALENAKKVDHSEIAKKHNKLVHNVAKFIKDAKIDEMMDLADKDLKVMALKSFNPNINYDEKSDEFIESAYTFIENQETPTQENPAPASNTDGFKKIVDAANKSQENKDKKTVSKRDAMIERLVNKHKGEQK